MALMVQLSAVLLSCIVAASFPFRGGDTTLKRGTVPMFRVDGQLPFSVDDVHDTQHTLHQKNLLLKNPNRNPFHFSAPKLKRSNKSDPKKKKKNPFHFRAPGRDEKMRVMCGATPCKDSTAKITNVGDEDEMMLLDADQPRFVFLPLAASD